MLVFGFRILIRSHCSDNIYRGFKFNSQCIKHPVYYTQKNLSLLHLRSRSSLVNYGNKFNLADVFLKRKLQLSSSQYKYTNHIRNFRTSNPVFLNPIVWVVLRPVLKFAAALTGRGFRKWWKDLPPEKRKYFLGVLRQNRRKILAGICLLSLLFLLYYVSHLEETPITKRLRFMAFHPEQFRVIAEDEFKEVLAMYEQQVLPPNHPFTRRVRNVVYRLLNANQDIEEMKQKSFTIAVVNDPMENAFVLPNGEIFVFVGMLNLCSNNDQLGGVLAHEISHCILAHGAENFSFSHIVDFVMMIFIGAIWAVLPSDVLALVSHWIAKQFVEVLLHLPYNRKIEAEADEVGLTLAAKACFDVRESSAFWSKMSTMEKGSGEVPSIEFLSTHPSHENRSAHLDSKMDEALKLRSSCGCPRLKSQDPRLDIARLTKLLEEERSRYKPHKQLVVVKPASYAMP